MNKALLLYYAMSGMRLPEVRKPQEIVKANIHSEPQDEPESKPEAESEGGDE